MEGPGLTAYFWIEAGPDVGAGHAVRAKALIDALAERQIRSHVYTSNPSAVTRSAPLDVPVSSLCDRNFAEICSQERPSLAVLDLPHTAPPTDELLRAIRQTGVFLLTMDSADVNGRYSDLFVHMCAMEDELAPGVPGSRRLLGPRYLVLRRNLVNIGVCRRPVLPVAKRILVAFGASDPAGLTEQFVEQLSALNDDLQIDLMVGGLVSEKRARLISDLAQAHSQCTIHRNVNDPTPLMLDADIGVFGFGLLFLEAAATGLPSVLWHPSAAHASVARQFNRHLSAPIALDCGEAIGDSAEAVIEQIRALRTDQEQRQALSLAAMETIDGRGAEHVATAVTEMIQ